MSEPTPEEIELHIVERLTGRDEPGEWTLDLRGLDLLHACASIDGMVRRNEGRQSRKVMVQIDAPVEGGGETLFLPIGRYLLELMKMKHVERFNPLDQSLGAGFLVQLPAVAKTEENANT